MKRTKTSPPDPKLDALRLSGTLHPHPKQVTDPLFAQHDFFDPRDTLQVKYEMLRRVQIDGQSISCTSTAFGCSRPTFYQAQAAFKAEGLAGLLPQKRGPHQPHKLSEEILAFVEELRASEDRLSTPKLLQRIHQKFDLVVHRRSLERALARRKKNASSPPTVPPPQMAAANELVANYETLRGQVLGSQRGGGSSPGWARLVRHGLAAWLQTVSLPTPAPLPAASATPVALAALQSEMTNILITMVWSHYQEKSK